MKNGIKAGLCVFVTIVMLLCGFVGCGKTKSNIQYDNNLEINRVQPLEVTETIRRLSRPNEVHISMSMIYDLDTLKDEGIVKIVRLNKNRVYSVTPLKNHQYLFLLYSSGSAPLYVVDGFLVSTLADKTTFGDVTAGMPKEDVLKKDPSSCVFEEYSFHRFKDKSILRIKYGRNSENQTVVSEYAYMEGEESVLNFLLQKDMDRII